MNILPGPLSPTGLSNGGGEGGVKTGTVVMHKKRSWNLYDFNKRRKGEKKLFRKNRYQGTSFFNFGVDEQKITAIMCNVTNSVCPKCGHTPWIRAL